MWKTSFFTVLLCAFVSIAFANDYQDAWAAINRKDFKAAKEHLAKAKSNPATALDAHLTELFLQTYSGKEEQIPGLTDALLQHPEKNAYLYALWFNGAILGQYGKKKPHQLSFLNKIINDKSLNGSIRSAAHYVKALHHVYSNEYAKSRAEYAEMGAIQEWQLAGPFENLSGSGFNVNYGPLGSVDANTKFKGMDDIEVSWFTPAKMNKEGWMFTYSHLPKYSAIIYAQSFVKASQDMEVFLNVGGKGTIKVWVNDGLVLSQAKERATELDFYRNKCTLKKGYNRVLIQLGYTNSNMPNFIVRFTDDKMDFIPGLEAASVVQPYTKAPDAPNTASLKHFAEEYFEKKLVAEPDNLLNYVLLCQAYLRNEKSTEAREIIEKALKKMPDNPLLRFELIQCHMKANNQTLLLQEIEWLEENDPECYINYQMKIRELIDEEKYTEAEEALNKMIEKYGEDEDAIETKMNLLAKLERLEELLKLVDKTYKAYPDNAAFVSTMFRVKKLAMKDVKAALAVYEKYLKTNYNYDILTSLADEYHEQGMNDKYLAILKKLYDESSYDTRFVSVLSKYYYEKQDYTKALEYAMEALALQPYGDEAYNNIGNIYEQMGKKEEAIAYYKKAIYYDRTNYDTRKKLNVLQQKPDLYKLLPEADVYTMIKKSAPVPEEDYSYVLDEKGTIIYDKGASEEYITYAVKIYTEKGIDSWKELHIPYNDNTQSLLIEKSEVVKKNGSKVPAERNGAQLVFTNLEAGDAIYVKYRLQNYTTGRMGREFSDKFGFNAFVPSALARYTLVIPKDIKFNFQFANNKIEPEIKEVSDFKVYTWKMENIPALKDEPLMPTFGDVGTMLHISTLSSWAEVANWYSDISYQDTENNYELNAFYNEIFSAGMPKSNLEKARKIYNHIVTNIRYSSVPFRQSGLVPQNLSTLITARLGDCKDVSTLYVALLAKAGIKAQLVLIDTRDNGVKDMLLPSMDFNHCIVLAHIDGKEYYIELTDNNLPFGSMPDNLHGALSLVIPPHGQKSHAELKPLIVSNRTPNRSVRTVDVMINGRDQKIVVSAKRFGSITSKWRNDYGTLSAEKQKEYYEQSISNGYNNPVKLESLSFIGLNDLRDSLVTNYSYTVKNEVIEAGSMKMIRVPFIDLVATLENFSADKREYPIEYWKYENVDEYVTTVTIQAPADLKVFEVPANVNYSYKGNTYSLKFVKQGVNKVIVHRSAKLVRENIPAAEYATFKKFFNDIVEAESKYVVFK